MSKKWHPKKTLWVRNSNTWLADTLTYILFKTPVGFVYFFNIFFIKMFDYKQMLNKIYIQFFITEIFGPQVVFFNLVTI